MSKEFPIVTVREHLIEEDTHTTFTPVITGSCNTGTKDTFIGGESVFGPRRNSVIYMITGHTKRRVAEATSYQIVYHVETGTKNGKLQKYAKNR